MDSLRSLWHSPLALQRLSTALVWAAGLSLVIGLGHWLASRPAFALRMVEVQAVGAPMRHVQEADIRLAFANGLSGTTLTAPLHEIQSRLAAHPWVRQVSIRRIWPNRLLVRVEEHQPLASWEDGRFFNQQGELFLGEESAAHEDARRVYGCLLPALSGPVGTESRVLGRALDIQSLMEAANAGPADLTGVMLTPHFAWRLTLSSGMSVELGRDSLGADWRLRLGHFLESRDWLQARLAREAGERPTAVDLRYANGYAYRAVSMGQAAPTAQKASPPASAVSCLRHFQQEFPHDT
jgi:cell division protein FtsQ